MLSYVQPYYNQQNCLLSLNVLTHPVLTVIVLGLILFHSKIFIFAPRLIEPSH